MNAIKTAYMKYLKSAHCDLLGKPRDILVLGPSLIVSSYGHNALFLVDRATFELRGVLRLPHMVNPRGLYARNEKLHVA